MAECDKFSLDKSHLTSSRRKLPFSKIYFMLKRKLLNQSLIIYTKSDIELFYLNVRCGDILQFYDDDYDGCYYYGVFIDEGGLRGASSYNIVHFKTTPNRVERTFLTELSDMTKSGLKTKSDMLIAVRNYKINKIGINSIEEMLSFKDKVKIDNKMEKFWNCSIPEGNELNYDDKINHEYKESPIPYNLLKHSIDEWIYILKKDKE